MSVMEYAKSHPYLIGAGILVGGYILLKMMGGSSSSGDSSATSAYYAASTQEALSGDQVSIAQIQANASEKIAQIQASTSTTNNTTWANANLATTQSNNATAIAVAPYSAIGDVANALASVASQTSTTTKNSGGFFGIGKSSSTTTTSTPAAKTAAAELGSLFGNFFAGH